MTGYVKIYGDELKMKQIRLYNRYYCQVCSMLKKDCGGLLRFFNSYDIVVPVMIFDSISEKTALFTIKCPICVSKKEPSPVSPEALRYGVLLNIYALIRKIKDDRADINPRKHFFLNGWLSVNAGVSKIIKTNENLTDKWDGLFNIYYDAEKRENSTFDELSNLIGRVYGEIFMDYIRYSGCIHDGKTLYDFGFNYGKFIYLMDAYDDYFSDIKKGRFNPITRMNSYAELSSDIKEISGKVRLISDMLIGKLVRVLEAVRFGDEDSKAVAGNAVSFGMMRKFEEITAKKYKEAAAYGK